MKSIYYTKFKDDIEKLRFQYPEKQKEMCLSFLNTAQEEKDSYGIFLASLYLLDYYIAIRDNNSCQTYLSLGLFHKDDSQTHDVSHFYMLCGIYSFMSGDAHTAITYNCDAIHLCDETKNYERKAGILNNIALIFHECDAYEEALYYYTSAYELMLKHSDHHKKRNMTIILGNIVSCYQEIGDITNAQMYFEKLSKNDIFLAMHKCLEANIACLSNDNEKTIQYCIEAYEALKEEYIDQHLSYTIHEDIVKLMLKVGTKEQCFDAIKRFFKVSDVDHTFESLTILHYYIEYARKFDLKEELHDSYSKYYELNEENESIKKITRVTTYRDQILLDKMIRLNQGLKTSASYDSVTGLKNRNAFEYDIKQHLDDNEITMLSLMMCDVDNFKEHNDHFGHLHGDKILRKVGEILNSYYDDDFIAYRFGGDEFLCLGINKTKEEMEKYLKDIYNSVGVIEDINLSCGYTCHLKQNIASYIDLIDKADTALYRAKESGKNQYMYNA